MIKPSDGSVLALAGLAVSAPQPPGSSFKIITAAAGAAARRRQAVELLSGAPRPRRCRASSCATPCDEQCGGSLTNSFAHSCNCVFGPLGAKLGAKRLVATAEKFGFNETARPPGGEGQHDPEGLRAQGQPRRRRRRDRPEQGQRDPARDGLGRARRSPTTACASSPGWPGGRNPRKRVGQRQGRRPGARHDDRGRHQRHRPRRRDPGRHGRGQDRHGRARPTADIAQNPENTTAWFVAFAPADNPSVAVAVMLPERGSGRRLRRPDRQARPAGRAVAPRGSRRSHSGSTALTTYCARVDDLGDLEVDDEAAEQVGVLAREAVGRGQVVDHRPRRVLRGRVEVAADAGGAVERAVVDGGRQRAGRGAVLRRRDRAALLDA